MSKKMLYLLGILCAIIAGSILNWMFCCNYVSDDKQSKDNQNQRQTEISSVVKTPSVLPFKVKDIDGNLSLEINDNFNFKTSSANFMKPVASNLKVELIKLKDYVISKKTKSLSITGYYTTDETNNSIYPNLGLARANSVKNYLTSLGISSKIIDTYGKQKVDLVANKDGFFKGATDFSIANAKNNTESLKTLKAEIKENPLILYFKTGQSSINLTPIQRLKIANISRYLDKIDGAKAMIIGHTDNTGNAQKNMSLGQKRADFVKGYFVKNGISDSNIISTSKGPNQPIADNNTEEGKAKNRRTVVTIQ